MVIPSLAPLGGTICLCALDMISLEMSLVYQTTALLSFRFFSISPLFLFHFFLFSPLVWVL